MKRNDATFKEMVARLQSGELTRDQAADAYGINPGTLNVWISRSKLGDTIPNLQGKSRAGAAVHWPELTPDEVSATEAAIARVLAGEVSALAATKADPRISASTLAKRVRKARIDRGIPVQGRKPHARNPA